MSSSNLNIPITKYTEYLETATITDIWGNQHAIIRADEVLVIMGKDFDREQVAVLHELTRRWLESGFISHGEE